MEIDALFKILSLGAVGVAGLALVFWREAYKSLVASTTGPAPDTEATARLRVLAGQLGQYQKLVVVALLISALVQLAAPAVESLVKRAVARHPLVFSITPADVMDGVMNPAITLNGNDLTPDQPKGRKFSITIDRESNVDVNVLHMRDKLNQLNAQMLLLAAKPSATATGPAQVGFDVAP